MKRVIGVVLAVIMLSSLWNFGPVSGAEQKSDGLHIVTTIFPLYDWVQVIMGEEAEHADLVLLYDNGVDPHSFQPTVQDIMTVSSCDLFIYIGGESDEWVESALETAVNPDMKVLKLMEALQDAVREEDLTNILQAEESEEPELQANEVSDDTAQEVPSDAAVDSQEQRAGEETGYDEHIWLSLRNAEQMVQAIADELTADDPSHASLYQANASTYNAQLQALDQEYRNVVQNSSKDTLLFGDRFPFLYLTEDYGLCYYAAFAGCSAETEASFETIITLAQKIDELGLSCVLTIEGSDQRIAETLIQSTKTKDQLILTLNSIQSVTAEQAAAGEAYLDIMKNNLEVLRQALE